MQIKIKYALPIWWVNFFWFEDADIIDIIDTLVILDLSGTDLIECTLYVWLYWNGGLSYIFWHGLWVSALSVAGIYTDVVLLWQQILNSLNELFQSVDHKDKNLSSMYSLVSNLYSIAVIQPLSTAEVERLFSQVALIKTSHRANITTETLSKILNIKYNCDLYTVKIIHVWDKCVHAFFKHKNRRLVNTAWLLF